MIEKFKALTWYIQLIVFVGIAALLYTSVYYFLIKDMSEEVVQLDDQIAQLKTQNEAAKVATQRINEFRALFASKTQEYDELKVLLPEEREITNVLQGLQDSANDSRLIVSRFAPREDVQEEFIMKKPVEIEVDSNFNNLRAFFEKMAQLQRIVSITDFKLNQIDKQTGDRTLHAQFLLTTYYATPEELIKPKIATPVAPNPNGQPPAPAANGQPPVANPPAPAPPAAK